MTLVSIGDGVAVPYAQSFAGFVNAGTIDAAGEKVAYILQAPKAGNVDRVCVRPGAITTGGTLTVRLETVDPTTGNPTGTLVGAGANGSLPLTATDDNLWFEVTLGTAAAVTRGQFVAIVVGWVTPFVGVFTSSLGSVVTQQVANPYTSLFTGTWAKSTALGMCIAVRYDDTTYPYIEGCIPASAAIGLNVNTGSSPDEIGNRIELPFPCRVSGIWHALGATGTGEWQAVLYDASNGVLSTLLVDPEIDSGTTNVFMQRLRLETAVELAANTVYRLAVKPTSLTNVSVSGAVCPSTAVFAAMPLGSAMYRTHRTDAGAWTDVATERVALGLIVDQLDDGAGVGGGGGAHEGWGVSL